MADTKVVETFEAEAPESQEHIQEMIDKADRVQSVPREDGKPKWLPDKFESPEDMAEFLSELGVDPLAFVKVFNSFGVTSSLRMADGRGRAYRATGVPTLIVHGKYRIETGSAGSTQAMLKVAEYLIDLERQ